MDDDQHRGKTITASKTTLEILEELLRKEQAGVTEIADAVGISKSSAHHHLSTLCQQDLVVREDGSYYLGLSMLRYGQCARQQRAIYDYGRGHVDDLARKTGEQAQIISLEHDRPVIIYQSNGDDTTEPTVRIGSTLDPHCSAAGKAILSQLGAERVASIIDRTGLPARTDSTITDREELLVELDRIQDRWIAFDDEEQFEGVRSVAAPVVNTDEELIGAISLSAPIERADDDRFKNVFPDHIQSISGVVEINAMYSTWLR